MGNNEHLNGMNELSEAEFNNENEGCILAVLTDIMDDKNRMSTILLKGNPANIIQMLVHAMNEHPEVFLILNEAISLYNLVNSKIKEN